MAHLPTINLNGDTPDTLIDDNQAVCEAAVTLLEALERAWPHGRNWQGAPDGEYSAARAEYKVLHAGVLAVQLHAAAVASHAYWVKDDRKQRA